MAIALQRMLGSPRANGLVRQLADRLAALPQAARPVLQQRQPDQGVAGHQGWGNGWATAGNASSRARSAVIRGTPSC